MLSDAKDDAGAPLVVHPPVSTPPPAPQDAKIAAALGHITPAEIEANIAKLVTFRNRNTLSSMETDLPPGTGVTAAAAWIESQLQAYSAECGGCLEVKHDTFTEPAQSGARARITRPTTITNVYAILPGSDPAQAARRILVTGHYDSRATDVMDTHGLAPGANDDASGVAVSLACAHALSHAYASGLKLPATLVFAAVAGEEQGLNGSAHLARLAKSEGWQLEAVLNNDIVGGNTTPGDTLQDKSAVRVFSESIPLNATPEETKTLLRLGYESDSPSRELSRAIADIARTYQHAFGPVRETAKPDFHPVQEFRLDRFLRGGDHSSFNLEGFPAVRFTEWREDFNHQHQNVRTENGVEYGDLLKFVDLAYVARVARLNAATMATLAAAPPAPVSAQVVVKDLDNNSTLQWKPGDGAPAGTQYEIVWRPLAAPDWTNAQPVPPADDHDGQWSITLPISKDNVLFGIRAVDAAGHRSPAVVPFPAR
ncbi:M20/M25/M40 family metallo-hydrolase [Silvibacterium dinghuense]|uniref:M20/M25/M40 family metallo-hydrolase n=1 Tax=Silvibacterium dinghuense TaxID=1560006 RepID=A0A4Q1SJH6_9BACT|nr:M20/M25/M40 family metallo-hydrolase [Silvibacterium dinghuense]RXS97786.1 M20/M25/M40 family metallo-hydrolase [Silvibacterium dinghuense]GGH01979.1 aminopeptidase [Silvibacterium dinghuense]